MGLGVLVSFECSMVCVLGSVSFLGSLLFRLVLLWLFFRVLFLDFAFSRWGVGFWCLAADACLFFVREFRLLFWPSLFAWMLAFSLWGSSKGNSLFGVTIGTHSLPGTLVFEVFLTILPLMLVIEVFLTILPLIMSCAFDLAAVIVCLLWSCWLGVALLGIASAMSCLCCCCCGCAYDPFAPAWGSGVAGAIPTRVAAGLGLFWTSLPLLGSLLLCYLVGFAA